MSGRGTLELVGWACFGSNRAPTGMSCRLRSQERFRPSDPTYPTSKTVPRPTLRWIERLMLSTRGTFVFGSHAVTVGGVLAPSADLNVAIVSYWTTGVWTIGKEFAPVYAYPRNRW